MTQKRTMVLQTVFLSCICSSSARATYLDASTISCLERPRTNPRQVPPPILSLLPPSQSASSSASFSAWSLFFFKSLFLMMQVSDSNDQKRTMVLQTVLLVMHLFSIPRAYALG
jgi:hypothetical protein